MSMSNTGQGTLGFSLLPTSHWGRETNGSNWGESHAQLFPSLLVLKSYLIFLGLFWNNHDYDEF